MELEETGQVLYFFRSAGSSTEVPLHKITLLFSDTPAVEHEIFGAVFVKLAGSESMSR